MLDFTCQPDKRPVRLALRLPRGLPLARVISAQDSSPPKTVWVRPFRQAQQPYLVSSVICPRTVLLDDGVCDDEEFSHGSSDRNLWCFPLGTEVLIEVADGWIEADGG
jgi:hypothetical protein